MGNVVEFKKSKLVEDIYKESFGVNLTPEKVAYIRLFSKCLFDSTDTHVAVVKENDTFKVVAVPYYQNLSRKVSFMNFFKFLYKKTFSKMVVGNCPHKVKDIELFIIDEIIKEDVSFEFVRVLPEIPAYKLEEILNEQNKDRS